MSNNKIDFCTEDFNYFCDICLSLNKKKDLFTLRLWFEDEVEKPLIKICDKCRTNFDLKTTLTIETNEGVFVNQYALDRMG